jgi:GNAT superfamily N-acetyltransferase
MQQIDQTTTKNNVPVQIWESITLDWTPVLSMVLRTYAEIVDNKFATPSVDPLSFGKKRHKLTKVIWAQLEDGTPLGGIYYHLPKNVNQPAFILLSFTSPDHRGQGINSLCHNYLEQDCIKSGYKRLASNVHLNNESRLKSTVKVGMKPIFYTMYKKIAD